MDWQTVRLIGQLCCLFAAFCHLTVAIFSDDQLASARNAAMASAFLLPGSDKL